MTRELLKQQKLRPLYYRKKVFSASMPLLFWLAFQGPFLFGRVVTTNGLVGFEKKYQTKTTLTFHQTFIECKGKIVSYLECIGCIVMMCVTESELRVTLRLLESARRRLPTFCHRL